MSSNAADLYAILAAAGFPDKVNEPTAGVFALVPNHGLNASDQVKVQNIIAAFDPSDAAAAIRRKRANWGGDGMPPKVLAALLLTASPQWSDSTLSAAEKTAITAFLKTQAATIIAAMRS